MREFEGLSAEREARERRGLLRALRLAPAAGGAAGECDARTLNFSSNDYLDLARDPRVVAGAASAARAWGAGAGASRLMAGTLPCHEDLERALAEMKGYPSALVFGSGYAANLGALGALLGSGDLVLADRLAHASLLDGARLAGARLVRFRHNDADDLRRRLARHAARRRLVLTESVFSMDGDLAPLEALADACEEYGALLMVDDAHATGVLGPGGAGAVRAEGLEDRVALTVGTLSKALGSHGGFVACTAAMRDALVQGARSFIYSTALPPPSAGAALAALRVLATEPDRPERLRALAAGFRARLRAAGIPVAEAPTPIVPVHVGDNGAAVRLAAALDRQGIRVTAVRPPTVPAGTARLRLSVTLAHTEADLDRAAAALAGAMAEMR